jgi:hypothetical protein
VIKSFCPPQRPRSANDLNGGTARAPCGRAEASLASLEHRSESGSDPRLIGAADVLQRGRHQLVQDLLEALTAMARTHGRLALGGEAARIGGDELSARDHSSIALR